MDEKVIWFEALTPKQAMLFIAIGHKLKQYGFTSHYTTRKHDYIHDIFQVNSIKPSSFGDFGKTLEEKLVASVRRLVELSEHVINLKNKPIAAISFSSPDASRVAFGLGIPLILLNDTAHSTAIAKLTCSLANYLITPSCIPKDVFIQYGANPNTIYQYQGVDEVEYISGENFQKFKKLRATNRTDEWQLVFRPEESFASYMKDKNSKYYLEILEEIIASYPGKIIACPRYDDQKDALLEKFDGKITVQTTGLYFLDLLAKADVVISGGGTMAREAALLGIPSITYFWRHLEPHAYIEERGFPSYSIQNIKDVKKFIRKICQKPQKYWVDTEAKISFLQKPSDTLIPIMQKDNIIKNYFK